MKHDDDLVDAIVDLGKVAERVQSARSNVSHNVGHLDEKLLSDANLIKIKHNDILEFENSLEPIIANRLLRIISNSARNSSRLSLYVTHSEAKKKALVKRNAAARYVATLNESLNALAKLLGYEPSRLGINVYEDYDEGEIPTGITNPLERAFIYERLKTIRNRIIRQVVSFDEVVQQIDNIMEELKVNGGDDNG